MSYTNYGEKAGVRCETHIRKVSRLFRSVDFSASSIQVANSLEKYDREYWYMGSIAAKSAITK
jgi:hypothetical protein